MSISVARNLLRLFHPLRPLTESGRVFVCVAAALFAALVLVAWSPTHAEAADSTPITCAPAAG